MVSFSESNGFKGVSDATLNELYAMARKESEAMNSGSAVDQNELNAVIAKVQAEGANVNSPARYMR